MSGLQISPTLAYGTGLEYSTGLFAGSGLIQAGAGWKLIASGSTSGPGGSAANISLNTAGADLIVLIGNCYQTYGTPAFSDSEENTWTIAATNGNPSRQYASIAFCEAPITNAEHVLTKTNTDAFGCFFALAYSGSAAAPLDQTNSNLVTDGTSETPGSITPTANGELLVFATSFDDPSLGATPTVDSGFSVIEFIDNIPGQLFGLSVCTFAQGAAASINPTLTRLTTGTSTDINLIASFKRK